MPGRPRVLVAMSGGVDSSVAAAMLRRDGWDVIGCFMRLGSVGDSIAPEACEADAVNPGARAVSLKVHKQGCCSISDAADARAVAAELDIPLYVCNFKRDFGRVIDYFVDEYAQGRTPNPCVRCNDWLKFGRLHEYARQLGCDYVASGHYARIMAVEDLGVTGPRDDEAVEPYSANADLRLAQGVDRRKDQSYVLFGLPRAQLASTFFPVGGMPKDVVRDRARRFGLPVFDKPDSQEICFVPGDDYAALVESRRPELMAEGDLLDEEGRRIGTHAGHHRFTIGQRRGIRIAAEAPLYVLGKSPTTNTVTVGSRERLLSAGCDVGEANWLCDVEGNSGGQWLPCLAKVRYNSSPTPAEFQFLPAHDGETPSGRTGRFRVRFASPQQAVAPGQALVLYAQDGSGVVLGGGWIDSTAPR